MALTMLFYDLAAFVLAVYFRSILKPFFFFVLFHLVFYWWVFGFGFVSPLVYLAYYPLTFLLWTVVGMSFYWGFNSNNLFSLTNQQEKGTGYLIRLLATLAMFISVALPFELIPHTYAGGIFSLIAAVIACLIAFFVLKDYCPVSTKKGKNITDSFFAYFFIVFLISIGTFWPIWKWTNFDQLYTSLIIGGGLIVFFVVLKFALFSRKSSGQPDDQTYYRAYDRNR